MPKYSFGKDSPLKLSISNDQAEAYNRVVDEFNAPGRPKDPNAVWADISDADKDKYNEVSEKLSDELISFGRAVMAEEYTDIHLIKN